MYFCAALALGFTVASGFLDLSVLAALSLYLFISLGLGGLFLSHRKLISIEFCQGIMRVRRGYEVLWKGNCDCIVDTEIVALRGSSLMVLHFKDGESFSFSFLSFSHEHLRGIEYLIRKNQI